MDAAAVLYVGEREGKETCGWWAEENGPENGIGPSSIVVNPLVCGCAGETDGE